MIEVFVAYTGETDVKELERTLEAWKLPALEPVAIELKSKKFELHRRVTAENMSRGDYILCDLGYGPREEDFGARAGKALLEYPEAGMIASGRSSAPGWDFHRVVICRKGVISHWPTPTSKDYRREHREAYTFKGYRIIVCPTIHYRLLTASWPS